MFCFIKILSEIIDLNVSKLNSFVALREVYEKYSEFFACFVKDNQDFG